MGARIKEIIDRAISSLGWRLVYEKAGINHMMVSSLASDHNALFMKLYMESQTYPRPFRFLAMWARDQLCKIVVQTAWEGTSCGTPAYKLVQKIKKTKIALKKWNQFHFGNYYKRIDELELKLSELQRDFPTNRNMALERMLKAELEEQRIRMEITWRQKSRETWLKEGDKNSKFFHASTIIRRRSNYIEVIKDDAGEWFSGRETIGSYLVSKLQAQLTSSSPVRANLDGLIQRVISDDDNDWLCRILDCQEILDVVNYMPS
ncbi:hypothetical protein TorRG33x02_055530 [Trema orientale]|uniref:Endonuclease/exonuclease/phosphatase n=1 Tax=Trema orientale TaxID=63057 RepID=A0A2P5FLM7_TREOI|nr:hypothetical protein TorRG33x02_055530 [Trema orientale]